MKEDYYSNDTEGAAGFEKIHGDRGEEKMSRSEAIAEYAEHECIYIHSCGFDHCDYFDCPDYETK